jgi:hypothetical protein
MELVKIQEEGKILALTGATITSRAVTTAVKNVLTELDAYLSKGNAESKTEGKTESHAGSQTESKKESK